MAKHFIKGNDGHLMMLSDDEYKKHKRKGCFGVGIAIILFIIIIAISESKNGKSDNDSTIQSQPSVKKEIISSERSNSKNKQKETSTISSVIPNEDNESGESETSTYNTEIDNGMSNELSLEEKKDIEVSQNE